MSSTRGRRRARAAAPVLENVKEIFQQTQIEEQIVRKSLSTLQTAADNPDTLTRTTQRGTPCKTEKQKPVSVSKENSSQMKKRKYKRKATSSKSDINPVNSSTPNSESTKSAGNVPSEPKKLTKVSKKLVSKIKNVEPIEFQVAVTEILESPEASLSIISIPNQSSGYGSDVFDKNESNPKLDTKVEINSEIAAVETAESVSDTPQELYDFMTSSDNVTKGYWESLAEQRRLALVGVLHENELLRDQLEVIESDNSRLKEIVKDAERLAEALQEPWRLTR